MVPAAVGFQCPDCVRRHTRATRQNQGWFAPLSSRNPRVTSFVIIGVNAAVWLVIQAAGLIGQRDRLVDVLGLMPGGLCRVDASYYVVDKLTCATVEGSHWVPGLADGAWWQVVTSVFTHVNIMHLAMNCLTAFFLGPPLESLLGRGRFLATYLLSGLAGSLAVFWLSDPHSMTYGGSGALFGLMGALLLLAWRRRLDVRQLLFWLGLNVLFTVFGASSISWQGHLGGLVGGGLLGLVWAFVPSSAHRSRDQWLGVGALGLLMLAGLAARVVSLG
jgi:membrane associated rhomboid family serine protease